MDPIYQHTVLHNDPMAAAQLREVRIATSTVREADSTRKRVRAASTSHSAKRSRQSDLATELADTADMLADSADALADVPRAAPRSVVPPRKRKGVQRLGRDEAASRSRRTAAETPSAPRRRGENRSASFYNRGPGWESVTVPAGALVVDLT